MENKNKLTTVLVSGNFNVLHPGHLRLLRFAKESGDYLIVAVESDLIAGSAAYVPEDLRIEGIESNSWVNEAILLEEPLADLIKRLKPDIVIKGKEHQDKFNLEKAVLESYGGKLKFSSGEIKFSSLDLLRKEFYQPIADDIILPLNYMKRHGISSERIKSIIKDYHTAVEEIIIKESKGFKSTKDDTGKFTLFNSFKAINNNFERQKMGITVNPSDIDSLYQFSK